MTLNVVSQRVFIFVSVYFIMTQSGNFWIHLRILLVWERGHVAYMKLHHPAFACLQSCIQYDLFT